MPLSLNDRNPELIARVDDAYERALAAQDQLASGVGSIALDTLVEGDLASAREGGTFGGGGLEAIINPEVRSSFEQAFSVHEQLFSKVGLTIPTPDQLTEAGINLYALASAYEREEQAGHEPRVVLAPILSIDNWKSLYSTLYHEKGKHGNGIVSGGPELDHSYVHFNFKGQNHLPGNTPVATINQVDFLQEPAEFEWTVRIIPSTDLPLVRDVTHDDDAYPNKPTIAEYLTLTATQIKTNGAPLQGRDWLDGGATFFENKIAPTAYWSNERVVFSYREANREDVAGVRPVVQS